MRSNLAMRRLSGVALLAAAALGMGTVLAVPATAAATALSASPQQPRYPVGAQATIIVTATAGVGDHLTGTVTSGPDAGSPLSCSDVAGNNTATCTFTNGVGGAGVDDVTITDTSAAPTVVQATTSVAFETITAVPGQSVGGTPPVYLYGTGETASIAVTVSGPSNSSPPNLRGVVTPGSPDANSTLPCTQSQVQFGSWTCTLTNNDTPGADNIVIFDDDNPSGLSGQPDASEARVQVTVHFEQVSGTPELARDGTPTGIIDVTVTGVPTVDGAPRTPSLKERVVSGQFTTAGTCAVGAPPSNGRYTTTCSVSNGGRSDSAVVQIYDDLDGNNSPGAGEPSTLVTLSFETLTVTDTNAPHDAGSTAILSVTVNGAPAGSSPAIDYMLISPSTDPLTSPGQAVLCTGSGTSWTCRVPNTVQSGGNGTATDTVRVFDDANNNRNYDSSPTVEPSTTLPVQFGSAVTATPLSAIYPVHDANNPGSGQALINATVVAAAGSVPHLRYTVTVGPDADTAHTSQDCVPQNGGTTNWTCNYTNNGGVGLDTVVVYNDLNFAQFGNTETSVQKAFVSTDPNATVKADFQAPQTANLTPTLAPNQHQAAIAAGGCQTFVLDVTPGLTFPVTITATESLPAPPSSNPLGGSAPPPALSACNPPGGSNVTVVSNSVSTGGNPIFGQTYSNTIVLRSSTGQDPAHPGRVVFGISSSQTGTVNVHAVTTDAAGPNASSQTVPMSVITGGQSAVKVLTATPASQTGTTNGSLIFNVLAQDANGTPLNGVTIDYVVQTGDPDATTAAVTCSVADQFGNSKCAVKNAGKTGIDHVTFFAPQAKGETAPTASDPQTTGTAIWQPSPPPGSTMSLTCPDELVTNANQLVSNCTVSTGSGGSRQIFFLAHIADPSGAAVPNIPVQFTLVGAPAGSTGSATTSPTNTKGNAFFVVTTPTPAAAQKITVSAVVGDPAHGGLGPDTSTATFQAPHPARLTVSPASQHVGSGGFVNVTARVLDQFGAGSAGQIIDYTVNGRNSSVSGSQTTGSSGVATISYVDGGGAGTTDTISVLDVSADAPTAGNPSTAVASFSTTGCTVNCGGTGQKESPTLKVTQTPISGNRAKIKLIVTSHPRLVGATVIFYQVSKSGVRHKIGQGRTGSRGKVKGTLRAARGLHLRFQAKVKGKAGVRSGYSNVVKVHVH